MRPEETCPTCGSKLGPLHERKALRRCDACQRPNPRGFRYCGFCAAPLESEAEHAERIEVAAPPGGWPTLSRELVELRFFLDRGELDEAYELLSILHRRHPGHPALVEFNRGPAARQPRPDTHVHQVVDAVLAESSSLSSSSLPRRSVPQWNAPVVDDGEEGKKTRAHATVPLGNDDEEPTSRRPRPKTLEPKAPAPARSRTDKHLGAVPVAKGEAARRKSGATRAYGSTVDEPPKKAAAAAEERERSSKKAARVQAHTIAVPSLQPPKPFEGTPPAASEPEEEARPTMIMAADKALRAARAAKKGPVVEARPREASGKKAAVEARPREPSAKKAAAVAERSREAAPKKPEKNALRKRMLEPELASAAKAIEPRKRTGKQAAVPKPAEAEPAKRRAHGARFGQNVLGRFGKGKG